MELFEQTFHKNTEALKHLDPSLYAKLLGLGSNDRFQAVPSLEGPFNIIDMSTKSLMYADTRQETQHALKDFYPLREHNFLYFFGIGNGHLHKNLLKNPKHHLTVIEPAVEILFAALHLEDFSDDILSRRIVFMLFENLRFAPLVAYLNQDIKIYYARAYTLHTASPYYEKYFADEYIRTNKLIIDAMEFIITNSGNDIKDALMGLEHHVYNLPHMVSGTPFKTFITQRNSDVVIMVSTGPSLTKQLPLLKSIQNHATIICADSALRILCNHDITPDICVSLERIEYVAELFRELPREYKQKIIFVRASLQHKCVYETLEGCRDILVMRPHKYNLMFGLEPYGVLCSGTSVANMAHELSAFMRYKTCIIIGQDLAYGKDGSTHSKGHILGEKDESVIDDSVEVPAYGGKGMVKTNSTWALFRNGLIQTVDATKESMPTINATEGGANIPQTIEMSFSQAVDTYIDTTFLKKPITPEPTAHKEALKYFKAAHKNIRSILKEGRKLQKGVEKAYVALAKACKKLENKNEDEQLKAFDDPTIVSLLELISDTRGLLEDNLYYQKFYWEIMQSIVVHYELELATIKIRAVESSEENKKKALAWIYNHSHYFYTVAGAIAGTIHTIEKGVQESLDEIPEELKYLAAALR